MNIHFPCEIYIAQKRETGNATISASHTVIMEEFDEDVLENEEIIANVKKFFRDGCGCSRGVKGETLVVQCKQLPRTDTCKKKHRDYSTLLV